MQRRWTSFDHAVTDREFAALSEDDRITLFVAMKLYARDVGKGYVVKSYGDGLMMIKPKERQGRCLFFAISEVAGEQILVALTAYKKETQKLPQRLKAVALDRMRTYRDKQ